MDSVQEKTEWQRFVVKRWVPLAAMLVGLILIIAQGVNDSTLKRVEMDKDKLRQVRSRVQLAIEGYRSDRSAASVEKIVSELRVFARLKLSKDYLGGDSLPPFTENYAIYIGKMAENLSSALDATQKEKIESSDEYAIRKFEQSKAEKSSEKFQSGLAADAAASPYGDYGRSGLSESDNKYDFECFKIYIGNQGLYRHFVEGKKMAILSNAVDPQVRHILDELLIDVDFPEDNFGVEDDAVDMPDQCIS